MAIPPLSRLHLVLAGSGRGAWWITVGAVAIFLLLVLMRYELRLVSRRAGFLLLATRLVAMLILVAALFEPIAERRFQETIRGRVLVGVDLSESMATADPVPGGRDARKSESDPIPTVTRRETARRLVEGEWFARIKAAHSAETLGFARETIEGSPEALYTAIRASEKATDPAALVTDWSGVLARALEAGKETAPVLGVVLLTDGRENASGDARHHAERLAARGIPIYSVMIGSALPPKDVAIAALNAPQSVLRGDVANVEVVVKADGVAGVEVPVTLTRSGAGPLTQMIKGPADGSRPVVTFRVPMQAVGTHDLSVSVGPVFGDARADNDRRMLAIQVADDKAKVLLIDGEARWEFRYLYNALKRDPRVTVDAVIFRQPKLGASVDTYKSVLPPLPRAGAADPLAAYDAIFIGDVGLEQMASEAWSRLEAFVSRRGGALIISPGPRASPAAILGLDAVRTLLPVMEPAPLSFDRAAPAADHPSLAAGVAVVPTAIAAHSWPMFALGADEALSRAIWTGLPRLPWVVAGRAKPAATTLATVEGADANVNAPVAVIAAQPFGLGKVLFVGTDATWRWRFRAGDTYHHRFWGQVVRWAASEKLSGDDRVRFGPDRPRAPEGEVVHLTARFTAAAPGTGSDRFVVARVYKARAGAANATATEGEALAVLPMQAVTGQPGTFTAGATLLPVGRYVARLDLPQGPGEPTVSPGAALPTATFEVTPRQTSELVELSATRDSLDRLAVATGGRVFTVSDADQLPGVLNARTVVKTRVEETTLWDQPWALLIFFGVVTFEWILRKRVGLP